MTPLRAAGVLAAAAACLLVMAGPASAHADLDESVPAAEATVTRPSAVQLHFDEPVTLVGSGLQVRSADGSRVAGATASTPGAQVKAGLPAHLDGGVYTVGWVARSEDGDVVSGSYQFTVRGPRGDAGRGWWRVGAGLLGVAVVVGLLLALRRRSRIGVAAAVLVLVAGGLLLLPRVRGPGHGPTAEVSADPGLAGLNTVTVRLPDGRKADQVDVRVVLDRAHFWVDLPLVDQGGGRYRAQGVNLPAAGSWRAAVTVLRGDRQQLLGGSFTVDGSGTSLRP